MSFKRFFKSRDKVKGNDLKAQDESMEANPSSLQSTQPTVQEPIEKQMAEVFYERDNRAVRILRSSQADDFWRQHRDHHLKVPFLRYTFDTESEAVDALLSLDCIHRAGDTGNLLCTEPIVMGCYRTTENSYEVFLSGKELSHTIWSEAVRKFTDHRGRHRDQLKPETDARYKERPDIQQIVFVKEYYQMEPGGTHFYQVFKAPNVPTARSFLMQHDNIIVAPNQSILVETPEGNLCSDRDGIKESSRNEDSNKPEDHSA